MAQPQAYLNGRFVPVQQLLIPATDAGFVLGVTVAEQVRTVGGRLCRLDDHLRRLQDSLQIVGVRPDASSDQLARAADELVRHNHRLLDAGDDLGLSIFVTPGTYPTFGPIEHSQQLIGMHTYPLPFRLWARQFTSGQTLVTTDPCILPVVEINGRKIGTGAPGSMFTTLIGAWSKMAGIDLVRQAQKFAER